MYIVRIYISADPALAIAEAGRRLGPPLLRTLSVWPHLAMRAQESDGWILAKAYPGTAKCFRLESKFRNWRMDPWNAPDWRMDPWNAPGRVQALELWRRPCQGIPWHRKVFSSGFRNWRKLFSCGFRNWRMDPWNAEKRGRRHPGASPLYILCINIYIYNYIYIWYMCVCVYMCICVCKYICICIWIRVCM